MQAKVAHRSLGEGGLTQSLTRYGWQANLAARRGPTLFTIARLQHVSKPVYGFGAHVVSGFSRTGSIEQPDRTLDSRGTEVHVPLRRCEIHMPGQKPML
jgi:hypothetical protein